MLRNKFLFFLQGKIGINDVVIIPFDMQLNNRLGT